MMSDYDLLLLKQQLSETLEDLSPGHELFDEMAELLFKLTAYLAELEEYPG